MDLSSIHSRIPLEPGVPRTPSKPILPKAGAPAAKQSPSPTRSPELAEISLADLALADELLADAAVATQETAPRSLIHSRIPMDLRPPSRFDLLPQSSSAPRLPPVRAPQPPASLASLASQQATPDDAVDPSVPPSSPPPSPPESFAKAAVKVQQLSKRTSSVTSLAELGSSPLMMLWFFCRTEHTLGGAAFPPQRTAIDPAQRVQVLWNIVMLELAGMTLVARSRTSDTDAVDWAHVFLDAIFIAVAGAVTGAVSKLVFRCGGAHRWAGWLSWSVNVCACLGGSFLFAWFATDFANRKSDRMFAGWGLALGFTWCVVEPFWVLTVVTLVHAVVLPATTTLPPLPSAFSHIKYAVPEKPGKTEV